MSQKWIINRIFDENEVITISRFDLFHSAWNLQEFAIKVLMWGYPTKGRGKNIENLLRPENFDQLIMNLKMIEGKNDLKITDVHEFQKIKGLGLKTIVMSLWDVDDNATSIFMTTFYRQLLNESNKQEAFQKAQQTIRSMKKYESPVFLAAFIMLD